MGGTPHSPYLMVGPVFPFWRPAINSEKRLTFTSEDLGSSLPNPLLKNFIWPTSGLFLAPTTDIDLKPVYSEKEIEEGLAGMPTDCFYEGQAYDVNTVLQYNAVSEIMSFGLLPGSNNGYIREDGGNLDPEVGTLALIFSNQWNSDERYHDRVLVLILPKMRVKPGGFSINKGHFGIRVGFKSEAARDANGCIVTSGSLSILYSTLISSPNEFTMLDGAAIDTSGESPLRIGDRINLDLE